MIDDHDHGDDDDDEDEDDEDVDDEDYFILVFCPIYKYMISLMLVTLLK